MYSFGQILIVIWIHAFGTVSSGSWSEVISRTLLKNSEVLVGASLPWLKRKSKHGMMESREQEEAKAYSEAVVEGLDTGHVHEGHHVLVFDIIEEREYRSFDQPEPFSLNAITQIQKN